MGKKEELNRAPYKDTLLTQNETIVEGNYESNVNAGDRLKIIQLPGAKNKDGIKVKSCNFSR